MTWTGAAILAVVIGAVYYALGRRLLTVTVNGESMAPALPPTMDALVRRTTKAKTSEIVVVAAPDRDTGWAGATKKAKLKAANKTADHWWIKRIAAGPGEPIPQSDESVPQGFYYLLSDDPSGEDSRRHGLVPANQLLGVVVHTWDLEKQD